MPARISTDAVVPSRRPVAPRRGFVLGAGAAAAAAALPGASRSATPPGAVEHPVPDDPSKAPGVPLEDTSYGARSQFESDVRTRYKTATPLSSWTFTPLQHSIGIVTPSGLHFERSHAGTAIVDPSRHFLYLHGMVERPRKWSMKVPTTPATCSRRSPNSSRCAD